ncbi:MAG: hypothetical protein DRP63_07410, partial [Planctomycetota bacterium]
MRGVMVCVLAVSFAAAFSSAGCSRRSKKHKEELLRITTTSLPDGYDGQTGYSATLTATGGTGSYTWSITSGNLPPNLHLAPSTGLISGDIASNASANSPYTFTVEVTDGQQTASKHFDLVVNTPAPPKADFEANPTYGKAALTVNFTDKSTGNPTSWEWDFDNDGTPDSNDQNPTYTYSAPGWYTVKLTVSGPAGSDTCVKEKYVQVANRVYYVDGVGGDDANGGTGWSDAFATIGKALSVAGDYDLVLVADATYNETSLDFVGKKIYLKGVERHTTGQRPVVDCQNNGNGFYFGSGGTEDCVVDNFTIRNGSADYGGAIYCWDSSPTIINCVFDGNSAGQSGGAIFCDSSSPTIISCVFDDNSATQYKGGAIYCINSSLTVTNCTFSGNKTYGIGGAVACCRSSSTITNCAFSDNIASKSGGAIWCEMSSSASLTNCTFRNNTTRDGGGAVCCADSSSLNIVNCIFAGNIAGEYGGAIDCYSSSGGTVTNCTFSGNSAKFGGALSCNSCSPTLNNSILWGNSASAEGHEIYIYDSLSRCTLKHCCVDNTGYGGSGKVDDSNNCIHQDPLFVNAANGDYHLKPTSPCIDAGNNTLVPTGVTTDLDGNPR